MRFEIIVIWDNCDLRFVVWPFEVDGRGGRWDSSAGVPLRGATSGYPSFNLFEIGLSAKWRKGTESAASPHTREGKITLWAMGKKTKLCVSVPLCLSNQSVLHIYYLKSQLSQISNHNYHNYLKSQLTFMHCHFSPLPAGGIRYSSSLYKIFNIYIIYII